MTRYANVGDVVKSAVQLIRGSKSSRNIPQFGEKILYKPLKLSGHHRGNMEDTFLDGIFLGMRLRSDEILVTARGVIKTRTLRRRVEEEQWDPEFAKSIKGEPRQPVPGINSDHVAAGVRLEEDQADARLGQQDEGVTRSFDATRQTCYPSTFRYVEENVRHERFGKDVRSNTWFSRMCHDWQSSPSQSLGHMQGQDARRTGEE